MLLPVYRVGFHALTGTLADDADSSVSAAMMDHQNTNFNSAPISSTTSSPHRRLRPPPIIRRPVVPSSCPSLPSQFHSLPSVLVLVLASRAASRRAGAGSVTRGISNLAFQNNQPNTTTNGFFLRGVVIIAFVCRFSAAIVMFAYPVQRGRGLGAGVLTLVPPRTETGEPGY